MKPVTFSITVSPQIHLILGELMRTGFFGFNISEVAQRIIEQWIWQELPNEILAGVRDRVKNPEAR